MRQMTQKVHKPVQKSVQQTNQKPVQQNIRKNIPKQVAALPLQLLVIVLGALLIAQTAVGGPKTTEPNRGVNAGKTYAVSDIESVAMQSGNLMLNLPAGSLPAGRGGMSAGVNLFYNSKLWKMNSLPTANQTGVEFSGQTLAASEDGGWRYGYRYYFRADPTGSDCSNETFAVKIQLVTPDGGTHTMLPASGATAQANDDDASTIYPDGRSGCNGLAVAAGDTVRLFSIDNSFLRMEVTTDADTDLNNNLWTLYAPDGSRIVNRPAAGISQRFYDRHGNYLDVVEKTTDAAYSNRRTTSLRDEFNRQVVIEYDAANNEDRIHSLGFNGADLVTRVTWKNISVNKKYMMCDCSAPSPSPPNFYREFPLNVSFRVVDKVYPPEQLGGNLSYEFGYNADATSAPDVGWGEINHVKTASNATSDYEYGYDNVSGQAATAEYILANGIVKKTLVYDLEYDGGTAPTSEIWTYQRTRSATDLVVAAQMTAPDGGVTREYYTDLSTPTYPAPGETYRTEGSDGTVIERWYESNAPATSSMHQSPPLVRANRYVKYEFVSIPDAAGNLTKTAVREYTRDKNGNVRQVKEYDFVPYASLQRNGDGRANNLPLNANNYLKRITASDYYNQTAEASQASYTEANLYTYSTAPKIQGAVKAVEVQNAAGVPQSRAEMYYDNLPSPTNGNPTATKTWDSTKQATLQAANGSGYRLDAGNSIASAVSYDAYGNPTLSTDAKGYQTQITYGAVGGYTGLYPTQTVAAYGTSIARTSTMSYDFSTGLATTATDVDNNVATQTFYDDLGRPTKTAAAVGTPLEIWTQTVYDDANRRVTVKSDVESKGDARKVAVQFYDQLGRVRLSKSLEDAAIQSATNETDGIKVQTRYKTANGYTYQLSSNPYRAATSGAATNDPTMGWTLSTAKANGKHSEVETFAGAGLPTVFNGSNTNSTGKVQTDTDADRTLVTDQAGKQRLSRTNALEQLTDVWEITAAEAGQTEAIGFGSPALSLNGFKTSYAYDTLSNLVTVSQGVQTRSFTYSSLSRLKSATNPELGITSGSTHTPGTISYLYDDNGNLTSKTDPRNVVTTYVYDALNRVSSRNYTNEPTGQPATPSVVYTYDTPSIAFSKGKLTKVTTTGTGANTFSAVTDYQQFDQMGRVTQSQQTVDGVAYGISAQLYKYNLSGALLEQTYPSGRVVKNVLDNEGDLALVQSKKNGNYGYWNYAKAFTYNAARAVSSMQLGNGKWESTVFNSRLQPMQIALGGTQNGSDLLKLNFTYNTTTNGAANADNNGNVISQTITVPTETRSSTTYTGFTATQNYSYDSLNRLKSAEETIPSQTGWKQTFKYDRYGNRQFDYGANPLATPALTTTPGYQNSTPKVVNPEVLTTNNRLKQDQDNDNVPDYLYDAAGNTTRDVNNKKFTYDGENHQTKVEAVNSSGTVTGTLGEYYYDGDGKRVKKKSATETTIFIYDAGGKLVAEYANQIAVTTAQVSYLTADHLGSPRINTDQNGKVISRHDYQPFGEEIYSMPGNTARTGYSTDDVRKQFTAYERDNESGLDYAKARYFSSGFGRFSSPDDFLKDSLVIEPQSWNKYAYARNNPLKYIDPEGEKATVNIETDEKNKTITVKVNASIVFYGEKGVSNQKRDQAAQNAAQNIANGWSGTYKTKDGFTVKVETSITYTTRDTMEQAEEVGAQNVIGLVNGNASSAGDSETGSGGFDVISDKPDYGRWNINSINKGVAQHEFGHLLGVDDRYKGNELMNTKVLSNPTNSTVATSNDYQWAFGGIIDSHRSESRPQVAGGRQWETLNASPSNQRGEPQNHNSTTLLRAGRIWWN